MSADVALGLLRRLVRMDLEAVPHHVGYVSAPEEGGPGMLCVDGWLEDLTPAECALVRELRGEEAP